MMPGKASVSRHRFGTTCFERCRGSRAARISDQQSPLADLNHPSAISLSITFALPEKLESKLIAVYQAVNKSTGRGLAPPGQEGWLRHQEKSRDSSLTPQTGWWFMFNQNQRCLNNHPICAAFLDRADTPPGQGINILEESIFESSAISNRRFVTSICNILINNASAGPSRYASRCSPGT